MGARAERCVSSSAAGMSYRAELGLVLVGGLEGGGRLGAGGVGVAAAAVGAGTVLPEVDEDEGVSDSH
jgi:hypothetical protein